MAISSSLALYAYDTASQQVSEIGAQVQDLRFTTMGPTGGFGDLTATLLIKDFRLVAPQFKPYSNVALMDLDNPNGSTGALFLGRWEDIAPGIDQQYGDVFYLSALGASSCLKDDPKDSAYANSTAKSIISNQLSTRSAYLPIDQDTAQIFPDNPASQFSPSWSGKAFADILVDVDKLLGPGTYNYAVWDHPHNKDACGFPTWQLYCTLRDTTTVNYTARMENVASIKASPQPDQFINVVTLKYRDATSNNPATITVADARLAGSGAQGTAPFPRKAAMCDWNSTLLSSTEASTCANAIVNLYKNGAYTLQVVLESVGDANGSPLPLWSVRAGQNIYIPQLEAALATALPTVPTQGTNLFYITETEYNEGSGAAPQLTLTLGFKPDFKGEPASELATHTLVASSKTTNAVVQTVGASEQGLTGASVYLTSVPGSTPISQTGTNYKTSLSQNTTSISLTAQASIQVSSAGASTQFPGGFILVIQYNLASGLLTWCGLYGTNGN